MVAPTITLTRSGPAELARARRDRDRLLAAARELARALERDGAGPAPAGPRPSPLDVTGQQRRDLANRLARVEDGEAAETPLEAAVRAFDSALVDAVDAVRRCRQTEHHAGRCWFSAVPGVDGCAGVLWAAHRLG